MQGENWSFDSMQALGSRRTPTASPLITRSQTQIRNSFLVGPRSPLKTGSFRKTSIRRAVGGGADTLDQRKQEARDWIAAWKGNGSSASKENGAVADEAVDNDDDYDDEDDLEFDDEYEEDDDAGQDPDFVESPLSEGPFKYNIPNNDKGGRFAPDYTLADGSGVYTSKTLDAVKKS